MRNFIVAFMLVILLSSIMFVILRPIQPAKIHPQKTEKSNVEKLLTEPSQVNLQPYNEMSAQDKKETIENLLQQFDANNSSDIHLQQRKEEPEISKENVIINSTKQTSGNELPSVSNNNSIKSIQDELTQKYGNDPNAEISPEDVQNVLLRILNPQQSN